MYPVANMLNGIKTANRALRDSIVVPHSNYSYAIAEKLSAAGFVGAVSKKVRRGRPVIEIALKSDGSTPKINDITLFSKPSRRIYNGTHDIRSFMNGRGAFIYSTPKGILTDKEARKEHVGGEVLFSIW